MTVKRLSLFEKISYFIDSIIPFIHENMLRVDY
jgi:hypothetical protein